jgi:ATP-dependent Zn protease
MGSRKRTRQRGTEGETVRAAVHELGHAQLAVLLGRAIRSVRLVPSPATELVPRPLPRGRPKTDADRAALEAEVMLALAGLAAERVVGVATDVGGSLDDLGQATSLAHRLVGPARAEATLHHFLSVVERMLTARKGRIQAAVAPLIARGVLDDATVRTLLPRES